MFKSTSTSLILLGILAVIVGIIAIAWPGVTILALVILFAVYAFIAEPTPRRAAGRNGPGQRWCRAAACTWLAGDYASIGGRCWPEPAAVGSAEHDTHRGLPR